ncbi:hypothetical protein FS749_006028 [Ceratobasidium sp. UAMH 11750]|nr:hypothetical protein FS749_006028 [Ceratobasidium sp. UAMH 11750]
MRLALLIGLAPLASATFYRPFAPPSPKVAIIGAGAGGSSAAYWISLAKRRISPGTQLDIDVYDKNNYIGGRSTVVNPYGNTTYTPIEQGAAIFTSHNKNMMRAVSEFGFETYELNGVTPGLGVWDGKQFLYRTTGNDSVDNAQMASRYGDGPMVSYGLSDDFLNKFDRSYNPNFPSFSTVGAYASALDYTSLETVTLQSYLDSKGVNQRFTREFQTGSTRFNYAQDASTIQAVAGMASVSADAAHAVKGGNYKIFQQFLSRSGATVKLGTTVTKITKMGSKYFVLASNGATTAYDAVILAAPAALSGIQFVGIAQQPASPQVNYVHLYSTIVSTTTPAILPAYFNTTSTPLPGTVITTAASGFQPEFFGLRSEATIQRNGKTEYIFRVFSKAAISDATLNKWFGAGKVGWVNRKEWDAYPVYPPTNNFPPVKLDSMMYYVNSMEGLWSTMETEIISARNCVDLLAREVLGYGICGPAGPQGPKTDNYVLGWDC